MKDDFKIQNILKNAPDVSLNDLSKYSIWPERILGLMEWERDERTPEDIEREYERETYFPILEILSKNNEVKSTHELYPLFYKDKQNGCVCAIGDTFKWLSWQESCLVENQLIADSLQDHLPASAIVDLGAGTGCTALALAEMPEFSEIPIYALEKMHSARNIMQILAQRNNLSLNIGECDLSSHILTDEVIPENSIVFINIVISLLKHSTEKIVESILKIKPKIVFHFEPFYGFNDTNTLYGQMCARYMEINKYNMIFDSDLQKLNGDLLDIVFEKKNYFGNNPFFPKSIIAWKPKK